MDEDNNKNEKDDNDDVDELNIINNNNDNHSMNKNTVNDGSWICTICNWSNSSIMLHCQSCDNSKPKPQKNKSNNKDQPGHVVGLKLLLDDDISSADNKNVPELQVIDDDNDDEEDEEDEDDDLVLTAPKLMIDFEETESPNQSEKTPSTSPQRKKQESPSKSSSR